MVEDTNGDASVERSTEVEPPAENEVDGALLTKRYEAVVRQVILTGKNSSPGQGHTKRDVDAFLLEVQELRRWLKEPMRFKQHCEESYVRKFGGGRYSLGVKDPQSGILKDVCRCLIEAPALQGDGEEQPPQKPTAAHLTIPMTGESSEMPKDLNSFMLWFTKTQVEQAKVAADKVESELREERRQNRELLRDMLKKNETNGLQSAASQLGLMKSIIDMTQGFGGGRELSGVEMGLKIIESPVVQDLAQETIGLVRDVSDRWASAGRLDAEGELDMEAKEMTEANPRRKVTPEMYARKLKALTNGKVPDDVIVLCVKEVTQLAAAEEKKTGTPIPAKERLKGMYEGLRLVGMVTDAAHALNNFCIKGKRTTTEAAQYLLTNVKEKRYIEWLRQQSYETLVDKMEPWLQVKSLRQVATFYRKPEVAKVVREVLAYLKDPARLKKAQLPADAVPDFTEDDFGVDQSEDEGETLSGQTENGGKEA